MSIKKWISSVIAASLILSSSFLEVAEASTPYEAYIYNYWEESVASPAAFVPKKSVNGIDMGIGELLEPSDMVIGNDGRIYIADTGNKRIVITDRNWQVMKVLDGYEKETGEQVSFQNPIGLFVDQDQWLYVADSGLGQVIGFDEHDKPRLIIEDPKSDIIAEGFKFVPKKIAVDAAKRVYVVANGVFEGIMQFDTDGTFLGYIGKNEVRRNYYEIVWRMFSTQQQRDQMILFIPTEFSSLDIDAKGFVYATNIDINSDTPIKRLNPSGEDVLKRYGYFDVKGDILFRLSVGPSVFVDIKYLGDGLYSALDMNQGKVFTYDSEGNLLYIFGAKGNQVGTFKTVSAIEYDGEHYYVLDRARANVTVFEPTKFGSTVLEASRLHYNGYSEEAVPLWKEVLSLNSNYDVAYIGIGRSLVMGKQNEEAIYYFKQGMERKQYSVAYKRYRREEMKEHFSTVMTVLIVGIVIGLAWTVWRKLRKNNRKSIISQSTGRDQAL